MRLDWLEDIIAISLTGSFSAAAKRRRLTQSAFSRRVRQIEEHVGVELFDRSRKPVALRATTLAQSEQIAKLVAALRQLEADLRRGDRISNDRIVIASQHSLTTSLAPSIIQAIRSRSRETYVRLRSANLDECFGLLLSRQADVAIFYLLPDEADQTHAPYLETISIGSDRLIPVFCDARAAGAGAGARDIAYVAYPRDVFFGKVMETLPLVSPQASVVPIAETALTLAALEMAATGLAIAWVPEALARDRIAAGRLFDLSGLLPDCRLQVKAARLKGAVEPVEAAFWSQLLALQADPLDSAAAMSADRDPVLSGL
jgi:LysR family transcriptional regulator, hypochlorite-specific transcription factor HypT